MKTVVVYATDENYVKVSAISICSLLAHNPGTKIVALTHNVSDASKSFLCDLSRRYRGSLRTIDTEKELSEIKSIGANGYVSFSAYSRLFIPELLGSDIDRALYIDGDTLVANSVTPLLEMDLCGKPFAIGYDCLCNKYKKMIGIKEDAPYFNSGVLLIDLAEWRKRRCTERIFEYMANVRNDLMFGDQDYFSLVLAEDAAILPPEFNFLTHFQMFKSRGAALSATGIPPSAWYDAEQYNRAQRNPVRHHFLGHTLGRPLYRESHNPLRPLYRKFAAEAGVPEFAEQSRPVEFCYRVQHLAWKILPPFLFPWVCRAMYSYFFKTRYGV